MIEVLLTWNDVAHLRVRSSREEEHLCRTSELTAATHAVPGAWCLVPGAWCLVPGAWCLVPGAWCLVPYRGIATAGDPPGATRDRLIDHLDNAR
jgi:hypothetical protein